MQKVKIRQGQFDFEYHLKMIGFIIVYYTNYVLEIQENTQNSL